MRNWWNERGTGAKIGIVAASLVVVVAAIGGGAGPDVDPPLAAADSTSTTAASSTVAESTVTSSAETTAESSPTTSSTTTSPTTTSTSTTTTSTTTTTSSTTTTTTAPTTTTTTDPMAAFRFDPVEVSGSGDDVVDMVVPDDLPAVLTLSHDGSSNFAVISHTQENERLDLLVNTIGDYSGQRPVNLYDGENVGFLEVTADGPWTVRAVPFSDIERFETSASGTGDTVLFVTGGGGRLAVTHSGESNFVVLSHGSSRDLLVNEIGTYDGTVLLDGAALVLEIQADGDWTLSLE